MSDIPNTAGPWPGWAPGAPWPSSTGAALAPSSPRAELAEAQATIARLTEQLRLTNIDQFNAEAANSDIVEAATALRDYDAQFAYPGDQYVSRREQLVRALVAAVEEGSKS